MRITIEALGSIYEMAKALKMLATDMMEEDFGLDLVNRMAILDGEGKPVGTVEFEENTTYYVAGHIVECPRCHGTGLQLHGTSTYEYRQCRTCGANIKSVTRRK